MAQLATTNDELMRVVYMRGVTNVETVRRHYFNFEFEDDEQVVDRWELPQYDPSDGVRRASLHNPTLTN